MKQKRSKPKGEHARLTSETHFFRAMGTETYIEIIHRRGETRKARASINHAIGICFEKIRIFSRFDPESELSTLNRNLGIFQTASPDMLTIALRARSYHKESNGLFEPRILSVLEDIGYRNDFSARALIAPAPTKLFITKHTPLAHDLKIWGEKIRFDVPMDFSGIAKGYILDKMAESIAHDGWKDFLVDSGGDIVAHGTNREGTPWRIDIENIPTGTLLLEMRDKGIATSGITRRHWISSDGTHFHHLIHPKHPYRFSFDLLSVSAISLSVERADFLAKTLFLMGIKNGLATADKYSIPAIFVEAGKVPSWHISIEAKKYLVTE